MRLIALRGSLPEKPSPPAAISCHSAAMSAIECWALVSIGLMLRSCRNTIVLTASLLALPSYKLKASKEIAGGWLAMSVGESKARLPLFRG